MEMDPGTTWTRRSQKLIGHDDGTTELLLLVLPQHLAKTSTRRFTI